MPNELIPVGKTPPQRRALAAVTRSLVTAAHPPGLSDANGGLPRTILIARMLAGAADSDVLLSTLLCLPRDETPMLSIFGEPAGPAYKTHPEALRARFSADDPDAPGAFIDWRMSCARSTVLASFDPTCGGSLLSVVEILAGNFAVPVDVIFVTARNEGRPGLLDKLEAIVPVISATTEALAFDPSDRLEIPVPPRKVADRYRCNSGPLRDLLVCLEPGSQAVFASRVSKFAKELDVRLSK